MDIFVSFGVFSIAFCTHIAIHRYFLVRRIIRTETMIVYAIGGVVLVAFILTHAKNLPFVSLFLYGFFTLYVWLMYMTTVAHTVMPSSIILKSLCNSRHLTCKGIESKFQEHEVIDKRLYDLTKLGLIRSDATKFIITPLGYGLITIVRLYEKIFGREIGG